MSRQKRQSRQTVEVLSVPEDRLFLPKFQLEVLRGPDAGHTFVSSESCTTIGSAEQNDLVLHDVSISRHHLRIEIASDGFLLTDLDSTNSTVVGPLRLGQAKVDSQVDLRLGKSTVRFTPLDERVEVELSRNNSFGAAFGRSPGMRSLFKQMAVAAKQDVTVLLTGETGTGKELFATEIHRTSKRRNGPFIIVDCGAIPTTLIESELFGHVRGAFTNATEDRAGAFEEASGGTIFLDEVGELELAMQPRLLRVLEQGQVKRLGEARHRRVDVRTIAATNRDLQRAVNQGSFRPDLFYRLAVLQLRAPPLRQRPEDIEILIEHMLPEIAERYGVEPFAIEEDVLRRLTAYPWPGNVRELRNILTRMVTMSGGLETNEVFPEPATDPAITLQPSSSKSDGLSEMPFRDAKSKWMAEFERDYLKNLLAETDHNVTEAARKSGIDRVHLYRLLKKYGLRSE